MTSIDEVWPSLSPETRSWLIENNGDALPGHIVAELAVFRVPTAAEPWFIVDGPEGLYLTDAAVDWIEEVANGE